MSDVVPALDGAATAWLLVSAALVFLMVLGVGFFYGGMVPATNVLGTVAQSFAVVAVVAITWVAVGFSLSFGAGTGLAGDGSFVGLPEWSATVPGLDMPGVPLLAFVVFQMMFAIVTPALITGAVVGRWRFSAFVLFVALWSIVVYAPVAHWIFSPSGWAAQLGALDFAGGAVVHVNAGAAAVACVLSIGSRAGFPQRQSRPHNLPLVLVGTALLWFGWFGFNGGSALAADGIAALAVINTVLGSATGMLAWAAAERFRVGKSTTVGLASGVIAGLVAVTPAAGYVSPLSAMVIGLVAGALCQLALGLKTILRLDDSLDVAAVHLVGGAVGAILTGVFASRAFNAEGRDGLLSGGGYQLLGAQVTAVLAVAGYSFAMTWTITRLTRRLLGNRLSPHEEAQGLDLTQHGESAYAFGLDSVPEDAGRHRPAAAPVGLLAQSSSPSSKGAGR